MSDIELVIKIPENLYKATINGLDANEIWDLRLAVKNGTPLTPDTLADLLMDERIRGELKQDISYSKDIIDDVKCRLSVSIRDHRPCYCGAELREVWRESEETDADSN